MSVVPDKSVGAFRTISEVADDLDLPAHVLRFWETRFPQIRPLKRAGGRRYYRPGDVELLRAVRDLLYGEGYTIKGVQRLLRERGARGLRVGGPVGPAPGEAEDEADSETAEGEAGALSVEEPGAEPLAIAASGHRLGEAASLRRTLATIEECERLLRAAIAPVD